MLRREIEGSIPACAGEPKSSTFRTTTWRVYPRVCGGTRFIGVQRCMWSGLSPRVRGNLRRAPFWIFRPGSIPACAGEPHGRHRGPARDGVYPRVCGGTPTDTISNPIWTGLSPRVRGNRGLGAVGPTLPGSIPACAGEPCTRPGQMVGGGVYPRVCGGTAIAPWSCSSE